MTEYISDNIFDTFEGPHKIQKSCVDFCNMIYNGQAFKYAEPAINQIVLSSIRIEGKLFLQLPVVPLQSLLQKNIISKFQFHYFRTMLPVVYDVENESFHFCNMEYLHNRVTHKNIQYFYQAHLLKKFELPEDYFLILNSYWDDTFQLEDLYFVTLRENQVEWQPFSFCQALQEI